MLSLLDIIIILLIISSGILGFKRGFFKELVLTIGYVIFLVIAWRLKDPLANYLSYNMPFFNFRGLKSLNIIMYQFISFTVMLSLLLIIFHLILKLTSAFENVLKFTVILSIPSKIAGFFLGCAWGVIISYFVCLMFNWPIFDPVIKVPASKLKPVILSELPVLNKAGDKFNMAALDIRNILENNKREELTDQKIINTLLKYEIVNETYIKKLVNLKKL